jgi:uncharacterized protein YukE
MPDPTGTRLTVPPGLEEAGPTILSIATAIGEELDGLQRRIGPLHDYWTGLAHNDWHPLQEMWNQAATDLMAAPGTLGAIASTTVTNSQNYVHCEDANVRTWRSGAR